MDPARDDVGLIPPLTTWQQQSRRKFQDRRWLHAVLFLLTVASTTWAGAGHYVGFITDMMSRPLSLSFWTLMRGGLWYSATILAILGSHELGHYLACRYYDVDASLPYFLPVPFPLSGTMGAFIRIREPILSKRVLFDIGIAGPIAGFLVAVPALIFGIAMSHVIRIPTNIPLEELGEPLLFKVVSRVFWGVPPEGYDLSLHPVAMAAWFGLLVTALNLFPVGQLDGGHISYAVLGSRSTYVTRAMIGVGILLTYFSGSWIAWTVLMIIMLMRFGVRHPPTLDEHEPLDPARRRLAIFAVVMFALCFTPAPVSPEHIFRG